MMTENTAGRGASRVNARWAVAAVVVFAGAVLLVPALQLVSPDGVLFGDTLSAAAWGRWALAVVGVVLAGAAVFPPLGRFLTSRPFVFCTPLIALLAFASFKWAAGVSNELYLKLVEEDGVVETAGALAEFAAAFVLFWAAWRTRGAPAAARLLMLFIGLTSLFLGLEEINYGQRILGFDTPPELKAENYQESFNLHNRYDMEWFADEFTPTVITYWGLGGWLLAWIVGRIRALPRWLVRTVQIGVPVVYVASWFLPYALWIYIDVQPGLTISEDQEPAEAFLGFSFLAYALGTLVATRAERNTPTA
jgi:hypothetical protein